MKVEIKVFIETNDDLDVEQLFCDIDDVLKNSVKGKDIKKLELHVERDEQNE